MRPLSQHDHDDPRLQTEDIANADRRMDDEPADARMDDKPAGSRMDDEPADARMDDKPAGSRMDDDGMFSDARTEDEFANDEAQTRLDEAPTEQLPTHDTEEAPAEQRPTEHANEEPAELFPQQEVEQFRVEWQEIQTRFVDDPREAVQSADHLVAAVMQSLATTFTNHKHDLENQWQQGSDVETEDLRLALRRYRSFFNQLLNV